MRFLLLGLSVCFLMASLSGCGSNKNENHSNTQDMALIQTSYVSFRNLVQQYKVFGTVYAAKAADIVSYTDGVISEIWVKNGQRIKKGQNLLSIKGSYKIRDRQVNELDGTGKNDNIIHYSPIDGCVSSLKKYPGNKVDKGETLLSVLGLEHFIVKAVIFDNSVSVKVGQKVQVISENKILDGVVSSLAFDVNPDTGGRLVEIQIAQRGLIKIFPGESVKVAFINEYNNVLAIPNNALLNENGNIVVFIKTKNGYEKRRIMTGISAKKYVEVLSGLKENDIIATTGAYELLNQDINKKIKIED